MYKDNSVDKTADVRTPNDRFQLLVEEQATPTCTPDLSWLLPASRTGVTTVHFPLKDLVRNAVAHVEGVSFLPIDPEADNLVDRMIDRLEDDSAPQSLTRRV